MIQIISFGIIGLTLLSVAIYSYYFIRTIFSQDAPYIGSFDRQLELMKQKLQLRTHATIVDLGCGDGKALRMFATHYKAKTCIGYDINLFAIMRGRILNLLHGYKNIHLYHKNFYKADIHEADYIYLYLFPKQMKEIAQFIQKNKKSDCIIVANSFMFPNRNTSQIITNGKEKIYVYK